MANAYTIDSKSLSSIYLLNDNNIAFDKNELSCKAGFNAIASQKEFKEVYDEFKALSVGLSGEIGSLSTALSGEIGSLSTALSGEIDRLSAALSGEIGSLSTALSGEIDKLSTALSGEIGSLSAALSGEIGNLSTALSGEIGSLSTALSGEISSLSTALSGEIDRLSATLSGEIKNLAQTKRDLSDLVYTKTGNADAWDKWIVDSPLEQFSRVILSPADGPDGELVWAWDDGNGGMLGGKYVHLVWNGESVWTMTAGQSTIMYVNTAVSGEWDDMSLQFVDNDDKTWTAKRYAVADTLALDGNVASLVGAVSAVLIGEIDNLSVALSGEIDTLSAKLSGEIDRLSAALSGEIDSLSAALSGEIDSLSAALSGEIDSLSAALSGEISCRAFISVDDERVSALYVRHIALSDYHQLKLDGEIDPNTVYAISSDDLIMYGKKITELAAGQLSDDAATYGQLSALGGYMKKSICDAIDDILPSDRLEDNLSVKLSSVISCLMSIRTAFNSEG